MVTVTAPTVDCDETLMTRTRRFRHARRAGFRVSRCSRVLPGPVPPAGGAGPAGGPPAAALLYRLYYYAAAALMI